MFQELIGSFQNESSTAYCGTICAIYCADECQYYCGGEYPRISVQLLERTDILLIEQG